MATFNWKTQSLFMPNADCVTLKVSDTIELKLQIYSLQIAVVTLCSNVNHKACMLELANELTDNRLKRNITTESNAEYSQNSKNAIEQFKSAAVAIFKEHCEQFNNLFNQQ